jgi:hypothetical protein
MRPQHGAQGWMLATCRAESLRISLAFPESLDDVFVCNKYQICMKKGNRHEPA